MRTVVERFHFQEDLKRSLKGGSLYARYVLPKFRKCGKYHLLHILKLLSAGGVRELRVSFLRGLLHNRTFRPKCQFCRFRARDKVSGAPCPLLSHQLTSCPGVNAERSKVPEITADLGATVWQICDPRVPLREKEPLFSRLASFFSHLNH